MILIIHSYFFSKNIFTVSKYCTNMQLELGSSVKLRSRCFALCFEFLESYFATFTLQRNSVHLNISLLIKKSICVTSTVPTRPNLTESRSQPHPGPALCV